MGSTANYRLPYPESNDPPNIPGDMRALASETDAAIKRLSDTTSSELRRIEDQVDAAIIGLEIQATKRSPVTGVWLQFGNKGDHGSEWVNQNWSSRWPGGGHTLTKPSILVPYSGLWEVGLHFEADIGNSTWILSMHAPRSGYQYGNRWAWWIDQKINHGYMSSRQYQLFKDDNIAFMAYPRDINGAGGAPAQSIWLRVILNYIGPMENLSPTGSGAAPPLPPLSVDPTDAAQSAAAQVAAS